MEDDLRRVDQVVVARLASDVALVNEVARYIIAGGGKRMRPLCVLLAARAGGYTGERHVEAAAVIEFVHTATLLHDDVVDGSELRRGRETSNHVWGNSASVLVGDYLYSRAFQMMVALGDHAHPGGDGERDQHDRRGRGPAADERARSGHHRAALSDVIYRKTAKLFEAGAQVAAILAGAPPEVERAMAMYGRHVGMAFQLVDDALDYRAEREELGKNLGDDLAEGKADPAADLRARALIAR